MSVDVGAHSGGDGRSACIETTATALPLAARFALELSSCRSTACGVALRRLQVLSAKPTPLHSQATDVVPMRCSCQCGACATRDVSESTPPHSLAADVVPVWLQVRRQPPAWSQCGCERLDCRVLTSRRRAADVPLPFVDLL